MNPLHFVGLLGCLLPSWLLAQGAVQPCTVSSTGQLGNGNSHRPAVTPEGRWIAFCSAADNLVANDLNGRADVFVRDRATGSIELVSVSSAGVQANGDSWTCGISDDGRFVCFLSLAANLVPNDTNGAFDGFVRDRSSGTTRRVSVGTGGTQVSAGIDGLGISGDGTTVLYSTVSQLLPSDANGAFDVYVHTLATGLIELASPGLAGVSGNDNSFGWNLSADGRYAVFHSLASNLVPNDTNASRDIFVRDLRLGTTARVSVGTGGLQANGDSRFGACSADGRFVVFGSVATNLVPGDTNGTLDVFVHDRAAATTERVSVSSTGAQGTQSFSSIQTMPRISADGRHVAFYSPLDGLDGPANAAEDAFVHDRLTGRTVQVSNASTGAFGNAGSGPLPQFGASWVLETMAMATDPPLAVFSTSASNLVPWDGNNAADVFAIDLGLRCTAAGPAPIGGAAAVDVLAPSYPGQLFVGTFGSGVTTGWFLPSMQWLPLDNDPLLIATLSPFVLDANGVGAFALPIPGLPGLVGLSLYATAVRLDFTGPSLFPAIGNVVTFVIQ